MKTKQITFAGLAIALAIVVSTIIKLPSLPNGGSITLYNMIAISAVLIYNASYVLTEGLITLILLVLPPVRKMLESIKRLSVIH